MIAGRSEIRDGMRIDWDVEIAMDDGVVLRADVFRPIAHGHYPVLITHGPYGKGVAFYDAHFKPVWEMLTASHPETAAASSNRYQEPSGVGPFFHDHGRDRPAAVVCGTVTLHTSPGEAAYLLLPIVPAKTE
jgi:hypothetical protein